jgi:hypothetical protein
MAIQSQGLNNIVTGKVVPEAVKLDWSVQINPQKVTY